MSPSLTASVIPNVDMLATAYTTIQSASRERSTAPDMGRAVRFSSQQIGAAGRPGLSPIGPGRRIQLASGRSGTVEIFPLDAVVAWDNAGRSHCCSWRQPVQHVSEDSGSTNVGMGANSYSTLPSTHIAPALVYLPIQSRGRCLSVP